MKRKSGNARGERIAPQHKRKWGSTMRTFTQENGFEFVGFVDSHAAKELMNFGSSRLVFVAAPATPRATKYMGFCYRVYFRLR